MINKENLNEEQLQKLADIEQKGYLDRIPEDEEGAIRYINNWRVLQNSDDQELEETEDNIQATKKQHKKLTVKEKREKYIAEIEKHKTAITELETKLKTLEDTEIIKAIKKLSTEEKQAILEKMINK